MTPIQLKIYRFISDFIQRHGYAPLLKEIAIGVGISPKSKSFVSGCVHALIEKGLLEMDGKGKPRNIKMINASSLTLPLIGRIAAGAPIEAIAETEIIDLGALFIADNHFVLEVKGDSMIDEGILDGDKVICKRQNTAQQGDIVVALIDHQTATLKRIHYESPEKIMLIPANSQLTPQVYAANRITIQGIFVGLLRLHKRTY